MTTVSRGPRVRGAEDQILIYMWLEDANREYSNQEILSVIKGTSSTVRRAIANLVEDGLLIRRGGQLETNQDETGWGSDSALQRRFVLEEGRWASYRPVFLRLSEKGMERMMRS